VLKPNEAMIDDAVRAATDGGAASVGLVATFDRRSCRCREFPAGSVIPVLAEGALAALDAGDTRPDRLAARPRAPRRLGCDVIALAQFSLARAAPPWRAVRCRCSPRRRAPCAVALAAGIGDRPEKRGLSLSPGQPV
jgi:hypothetical protein